MFLYGPPDGKQERIGSWSPPRLDQSADGLVKMTIVRADDAAEVEHWHAELAAGRLPVESEKVTSVEVV